MKRTEVENIQRLIQKTFNGSAWHGPAVFKIIQDIDEETAFKSFDKIHSIAELVVHIINWRRFAIERLKGNHAYEILEKDDWKEISNKGEGLWMDIKNRLLLSQDELVVELGKINDSKLSELVDEKAYDYYTLLHGVIQHDIYHAGQISLLKKQ